MRIELGYVTLEVQGIAGVGLILANVIVVAGTSKMGGVGEGGCVSGGGTSAVYTILYLYTDVQGAIPFVQGKAPPSVGEKV